MATSSRITSRPTDRNRDPHQPRTVGPQIDGERPARVGERQRVLARLERAARCRDPLGGHAAERDRDLGLRYDVAAEGRAGRRGRQPRGERLVGAEDQVRHHDRLRVDGVGLLELALFLDDVVGGLGAGERRLDRRRLAVDDRVDDQRPRMPGLVVGDLGKACVELDRRRERPGRRHLPAVVGDQHRHRLDADALALPEDVEGGVLGRRRRGRSAQTMRSAPAEEPVSAASPRAGAARARE